MKHFDHRDKNMISKIEPFLNRIQITDASVIDNLVRYHDLLAAYNQRVNLISRKDAGFIWEHHIFPSLLGTALCPFPRDASILDFGSGGGLPGLILKIARPDLRVTLVDSIGKKVRFLELVIKELALENTIALTHRLSIRSPFPGLAGKMDCVAARAVSKLESIYLDCRETLKPDGYFLTWKGESDKADLLALTGKYPLEARILSPDADLFKFSKRIESLLLFKIYARN